MGFDAPLYRHAVLPSTMDEARRLAQLPQTVHGTVVQADEQTGGRGRFGNQWVSPAGNLYMTAILRPRVAARFAAQASFVVAVALADALAGCGADSGRVRLKWPNDVLLDGRKIAGILLEMESRAGGAPPVFMLAGIGVNVAAAPEGRACVHDYAPSVCVDDMRQALSDALHAWLERWQSEGFAPVRARWLAQAHGVGQTVTARMAQHSETGIFDGVDADGNLLMRLPDGSARIITGAEIHFQGAVNIDSGPHVG